MNAIRILKSFRVIQLQESVMGGVEDDVFFSSECMETIIKVAKYLIPKSLQLHE